MSRFFLRWWAGLAATLFIAGIALGQETAPQPPTTSIGIEIVRSMPKILESSGTAITAVGTTATAIVGAYILVQNRKTLKVTKEALDQTVAGNEKIDSLHQSVVSQQPGTTVNVTAPAESPELAALRKEHEDLVREHEMLKAQMNQTATAPQT